MKIIFVCQTVDLFLLEKAIQLNAFIFTKHSQFSSEIIIIADEAPWKFIVDNQLFPDEDYLCFLDETITIKQIHQLLRTPKPVDVISFSETNQGFLLPGGMEKYLTEQGLPILTTWWPSMNHSIKRDIVVEFVNFYYYTREGYDLDESRIFSAYTHHCKHHVLSTPYVLCCGESSELIQSINLHSPETNVICCKDATYSKPKMIYELITAIDTLPATLFYLGNQYRFDEDYSMLYEDLSIIKAWKTNETPNQEHLSLFNIEQSIQMLSTDIILFEIRPETIQIVRQWNEICKQYPEVPDSFLFSLLIKIYTTY